METGLGTGFLLGLLAGLVVAVTAAVIFYAKRAMRRDTLRKARETKAAPAAAPDPLPAFDGTGNATRVIPRPPASAATVVMPRPPAAAGAPGASGRREASGNTLIVEEVENREGELSASIQEVRDLLLALAEVISRTETASGAAADAFSSAREAIHGIQSSHSAEIREAQRLLIGEIDRVLTTNAALHSELDRANRGIADQRRQIEELRVQARVDGLTRIPNRAAFDERLSEYVSLFERTALTFSLLLLDIDHFKRVNDDHGHVSGDRILRGIASKIAASIRNNDFAARYGGEEFAVIFPGTPIEEALAVSDRIRADISKTNFRMDQKTLKITISGGIAECRPHAGPTRLVAAADQALYRAKNTGRNQILAEDGDGGQAAE